ncbi:MAG: hypothetical protein AB7O37_21050 [Vicinamibacteria bacterium]
MRIRRSRRTRGGGSLYQPTYRDRDGVLRRQRVWWWKIGSRAGSCEAAQKGEAEKVLRARLNALDAGEPIVRVERTTIEDLAGLIRSDYEANTRKSLLRLEQSRGHLIEHLGGERRAKNINEAEINSYISLRREEGAKPATINRELAALRRMFTLGVRLHRLAARPHFALLEERNARAEQLEAVLGHPPEYLQPLIETAYITGWRRRELVSRERRHLDLGPKRWSCACSGAADPPDGRGLLRVRPHSAWLAAPDPGETKSGEGRQFPLTPRLRAVLHTSRGFDATSGTKPSTAAEPGQEEEKAHGLRPPRRMKGLRPLASAGGRRRGSR